MDLSVSEFLTFSKCRYLWDYKYNMRLVPNQPNKHLWLGTGIHYALAEHYRNRGVSVARAWNTYTEHFPLSTTDILEYTDLGRTMAEHYGVWSPVHDQYTEVLAIEKPFHLLLDSGLRFTGVIDAIWRVPNQGVWLIEHKTHAQMPAIEELQFAPQGVAYMLAAVTDTDLKKYQAKGVMYNILRKAAPSPPVILKDGSVSKAKNVHCSPEYYRSFVHKQGYDAAPYEDFIASMPKDDYFWRPQIVFSKKRITGFVSQLFNMREAIAREGFYQPDPRQLCAYCDYRSLCELRLWGAEFAPLAESEYHKAAPHGDE
jgi:hypothetical protein